MSDKPLSVDEIMNLIANYGALSAVYARFSDRVKVAAEIRTELEKLIAVEPVVSGEGEYRSQVYVHVCGHVEWIADRDRAETGGGCDACESGSDDSSDWALLYRVVKS